MSDTTHPQQFTLRLRPLSGTGWDNTVALQVRIASKIEIREAPKLAEAKLAVDEAFGRAATYSYVALRNAIVVTDGVTERTAEKRIDSWEQMGVIEKTSDGS